MSLTKEMFICIMFLCQQVGARNVLMSCLFLCPYSW